MNPSIRQMLHRPVSVKAEDPATERSLREYIKQIEEQAATDASERLRPAIEALESSVKREESRNAALAQENGALRQTIADLNAGIKEMTVAAAKHAEETTRRNAGKKEDASAIVDLKAKLASALARNEELVGKNKDLLSIVKQPKPTPPAPAPVIVQKPVPEFDVQVMERDRSGAIKTVSIKPRH